MKTDLLRARARALMLGASAVIGATVIAAHAQNLQINLNGVTPNPLLAPSPFASDTQQAITAANSADATLTGDMQTLATDSSKLQALMNGLTPQQQQLMQNPDTTTQGLIQQAQVIQYYAAVAAAEPGTFEGALYGAIAQSMNDAFVANAQKAGDNPTVIANIATATTLSSQVATLSGNVFADSVNAANASANAQQLEGRDLQNLATGVQNGSSPLSLGASELITGNQLQPILSQGLINVAQLNTAQLAVLGLSINAAGQVVSNDGGSLISNDGATLISNDGATFVQLSSLNIGTMTQLVADGPITTTTGVDLGTVVAAASFATASLISNDGATLISESGSGLAALISNDGATLTAQASSIISHNAALRSARSVPA